MIVAAQCCRYPELYEARLDRGRELAIEYAAARSLTSHADFNARFRAAFPGVVFTQADFVQLQAATANQVDAELEDIVYGDLRRILGLNPNTVIDAVPEVAWRLGMRHWELVCALLPDFFILSDRPVPPSFDAAFSVVLGPALALVVDPTREGAPQTTVVGRPAKPGEVAGINAEAKGRAHEWLCASIAF